MRVVAAVALAAILAGCVGQPRPADPAVCATLFARYDTAARLYGPSSFDEDTGVVPPAPLSRPGGDLRENGCLTSSADLDGLPALAARLSPHEIASSGPAIRAVPVHLGIVTGYSDEAFVTRYFRGLGYRSRGIGAEGLGRRIYIGPFTSQGALDEALAIAREAGFIAPYAARFTRF